MGFIEDIKKAKLFGHPIHSMLVHFPSALFPVSVAFDVLAFIFKDDGLAIAAFYTLAAGLIGGIAAAIFGAMDFYRIPSTHEAWGKAGRHACLSILWLCLFTILFGLRIKQYPQIQLATVTELMISIAGVIGLIYSNFLGADLIFYHRIGIHESNKREK
jgi:uncharacterized membrane protein